jgi:hypothetical protein
MRIHLLIALLALSTVAFAADPSVDRDALLKLHAADRDGHLKGDADLLVSPLAPTITEVAAGHIESMNRDAAKQKFAEYFKTVKYTAWDDAADPIIKISSDGKMAWMFVQVKVEVAPANNLVDKRNFMNSAIQTYEKGPDGWHMTAIAATVGK